MADTAAHPSLAIPSDPEHLQPLVKGLHSLQQSGSLVDFTLKSGSQSVQCHKVVLAASSAYFSAMLRSDMKESVKSEASLDNIDFNTLEALVQYFYTGSIVLEYCNLKALVQACDFLQIQQMKTKCEKYLIQEINSNNCLSWCKIGLDLSLTNLMETVESKMCNEFNSVTDSDAFCDLSFAEVVDYISNDNIKVATEDSILDACFRWISHDISSRKQHLPDFLKHINIGTFSSDYLSYIAKQYENIIDEKSGNISGALTFRKMEIENAHKRNIDEKVCYVICGGQTKNAKTSVRISSTEQPLRWKSLKCIPSVQYTLPSIHVGNSICEVEGGFLSTGNTYSHIYHARFNDWTRVANMPTRRSFHASVSLGGFVYVMGGKTDNEALTPFFDSVDAFDIDKNTWQSMSPMPRAAGVLPIVARLGMTIYVLIDTCDENKPIVEKNNLRVLMYNVVKNKWSLGPPLPAAVTDTCGARTLGFQQAVYLVGGAARLCSRLRPESSTWENLTGPTNIRSWSAITALGDRIIMFGGSPDRCWENGTKSIMEYDVETDEWSLSDQEGPHESCCGLASVTTKKQSFLDKLY